MSRPSRLASNVHWSKDFVEHLRTVHFALMALCIGLVLILSRDNGAALQQIRAIESLKKAWPVESLDSPEGVFYPANGASTRPSDMDAYEDGTAFSWKTNSKLYGLAYRKYISDSDSFYVELVLPKRNWFERYNVKGSEWSLSYFPNSLSEFRYWWGALAVGHTVFFPRSIGRGLVYNGLLQAIKQKPFATVNVRPPSEDDGNFSDEQFSTVPLTQVHVVQLEFSANPQKDEFGYHAYDERTGLAYWFPIVELSQVEVDQAALVKGLEPERGWKTGPFERSFSALATEGAGLEADDLTKVADTISERAAKNSEEFEAFGMKFPLSQITLCGIVGVLAIQLYFVIYLRELFGKLFAEDQGWDVPWVCMDQTTIGKSIFVVTACFLPLATICLLSTKASIRLVAGYISSDLHLLVKVREWDKATLAELAALLFAIALTVLLGILSWSNRPRVRKMEVDSCSKAQLFE